METRVVCSGFCRCARVLLTPEKPPPIKHQWGPRDGVGGNTISKPKRLELIFMFMVVLGALMNRREKLMRNLFICSSIYISLARESRGKMNTWRRIRKRGDYVTRNLFDRGIVIKISEAWWRMKWSPEHCALNARIRNSWPLIVNVIKYPVGLGGVCLHTSRVSANGSDGELLCHVAGLVQGTQRGKGGDGGGRNSVF